MRKCFCIISMLIVFGAVYVLAKDDKLPREYLLIGFSKDCPNNLVKNIEVEINTCLSGCADTNAATFSRTVLYKNNEKWYFACFNNSQLIRIDTNGVKYVFGTNAVDKVKKEIESKSAGKLLIINCDTPGIWLRNNGFTNGIVRP